MNEAEAKPAQAVGPISKDVQDALLFALWHHQGGSSPVGQPIRAMLGIGQHARMTDDEVTAARRVQSALIVRPPHLVPTALRFDQPISAEPIDGDQPVDLSNVIGPDGRVVLIDDEADALTIAYMSGFERGKDAAGRDDKSMSAEASQDERMNDACLAFCKELPMPLRGQIWNHIRPAMAAALRAQSRPAGRAIRYMVSVDGAGAPQAEHGGLESARAEAERLAAQSNNRTARIRVLQIVDTLVPVTSRKWEGA